MRCFYFIILSAALSSCYAPAGTTRDAVESEREDQPALTINPSTTNLPRYQANWKGKQLNGQWASWFPSGQVCDAGKLKNGIPDGEWKVWYRDGQLRYVRNYSVIKWSRISEEIKRPSKHPLYELGRMAQRDRSLALSYLEPDNLLQSGLRTIDQKVQRNTIDAGSYAAMFSECLLHGLFMNITATGITIDSGYYNNGLRAGLWMHREQNHVAYGMYKDGKRNNEWKYYNDQRKLQYLVVYRNGKETYRKSFNR